MPIVRGEYHEMSHQAAGQAYADIEVREQPVELAER
jgi:hypothetical protein